MSYLLSGYNSRQAIQHYLAIRNLQAGKVSEVGGIKNGGTRIDAETQINAQFVHFVNSETDTAEEQAATVLAQQYVRLRDKQTQKLDNYKQLLAHRAVRQ